MESTNKQQTPKAKYKFSQTSYLLLSIFAVIFLTTTVLVALLFMKKSSQPAVLGIRVSIPSHFTSPPHPDFKDKNFYACVIGNLNQEVVNGKSGRIFENVATDQELAALKTLNCGSYAPMPFEDKVLDLSGLDKLTGLHSLYLQGNRIGDHDTSPDLSKNTALKILELSGNQLTTIDLSNNIALSTLGLDNNQLIEIDLSKNTALKYISLENNQLTTIDLSNNIALSGLNVRSNKLTDINISNNTVLENAFLENNQLTTIDLSNNRALKWLRLIGNRLTSIDLSKNINLEKVSLDSNKLTTLDISNNTTLAELSLTHNQLTNIDISTNTALRKLDIKNNKLTAIIGLDKSDSLENFNMVFNAKPMFFSVNGSEDKEDRLVINDKYLFVNPGHKINSLKLPLDIIVTALEKDWLKGNGVKANFTDSENNQLAGDSLIKSGDHVQVDFLASKRQFVVFGDVAHDGQVLFNDVVKAYHLSNQAEQDTNSIEFLAADVTGDGEVKFNDVIKIYHYSEGHLDNLW